MLLDRCLCTLAYCLGKLHHAPSAQWQEAFYAASLPYIQKCNPMDIAQLAWGISQTVAAARVKQRTEGVEGSDAPSPPAMLPSQAQPHTGSEWQAEHVRMHQSDGPGGLPISRESSSPQASAAAPSAGSEVPAGVAGESEAPPSVSQPPRLSHHPNLRVPARPDSLSKPSRAPEAPEQPASKSSPAELVPHTSAQPSNGASSSRPPSQWLAALQKAAYEKLSEMRSAELGTVLRAFEHLHLLPTPAFLNRLYGQVYWTCDQFTGTQLVGILHALAGLGCTPPDELLERLTAWCLAEGAAADMGPSQLSLLAYTLGQFGFHAEPDQLDAIIAKVAQGRAAQGAMSHDHGCLPAVSNCLYGLALVGYLPARPLVDELSDAALLHMEHCVGQSPSGLQDGRGTGAHAAATSGGTGLATRQVEGSGYSPSTSAVTIMWSLGKLGADLSSNFVHVALALVQQEVASMSNRELCMLARALSTTGTAAPADLRQRWMLEVLHRMDTFQPGRLAAVARCLADLGWWPDPVLLNALQQRYEMLSFQLSPNQHRSVQHALQAMMQEQGTNTELD